MSDNDARAGRPGARSGPRAAAYRLSRRQFLGGFGGMAVAGSAAAVLSGCGSGSSSSTAATVGKSWAKAPVTFTFLDTQEPTHLDPALETEFDEFTVTRNIYDPLVWAMRPPRRSSRGWLPPGAPTPTPPATRSRSART